MLVELSRPFGEIKTTSSADLEHVRALIGKLKENNPVKKVNSNSSGEVESNEESVKRSTSPSPVVSPNDNWCFVDSVTAIRFFRIDRAQVKFPSMIHFLSRYIRHIYSNSINS